MGDSFTHLHVHTEYSMLDGAARIADVVGAAAADGQPALGITDHGNMYGVLDFYKECRDQGIKPIIGSELYMAHESRYERPSRRGRMDDGGGDGEGGAKLYYHLTALAETDEGYRNLILLSQRGVPQRIPLQATVLLPGQEIVTERRDEAGRGHRASATSCSPTEAGCAGSPRSCRASTPERVFGVELNNRYRRVTWMTGEHPVLVRGQDGERRWVRGRGDRGRPQQQLRVDVDVAILRMPAEAGAGSGRSSGSRHPTSWRRSGSTTAPASSRRRCAARGRHAPLLRPRAGRRARLRPRLLPRALRRRRAHQSS